MTPGPAVECTCAHSVHCNHECHGRHCDPSEHFCSIEFLPDDGGLTPWGCRDCSPGQGIPHLADCQATSRVEATTGRTTDPTPIQFG